MGCLSVKITRIGGLDAELSRIGGMACGLSRIGGLVARFDRVGGMDVHLTRKGGLKARFGLICKSGIVPPYLEINPEVVWIWTEPAYNDVYSNTRWNIE